MNEHFLTGFIKQAALYNIAEDEALELLKNARAKMPGEIGVVSKLIGKRKVTGFKNMKGAGRKNPATGKMEYPDSRMYNRPSDKTLVGGASIGAAGLTGYALGKSKKKKDDSEKTGSDLEINSAADKMTMPGIALGGLTGAALGQRRGKALHGSAVGAALGMLILRSAAKMDARRSLLKNKNDSE